jgi:Predicted nucleic acid-binding protein, contains PIN domain
MKRTADGRLLVVCDACVLINFLLVGRPDLLTANKDYRFIITEHVSAEVTDVAQAEQLRACVADGGLENTEVTDMEELALFAELTKVLGSGEAAAVAVAFHRNLAIATDDRRSLTEVRRRLGSGRALTTPGILVGCIRAGSLSVEEADVIKAELERQRFTMSFSSFADLLA